ncbi:MAG: tripartite tricarboxylate transporter substrate binding protein [Xanthobacteraceae bacterium]|nr:tripartite tricarboxylate transporter substrate binding protein [Xanthobacteraceae bacterium]
MTSARRQFLQLATAFAAAPAITGRAWAQDYPTRPVRMIVPFAPGGAADITGRIIGQWLSDRLGQPFIIENRPGGGTNIGTEAVATATPDGYTLLVANAGNAINATLYRKLNFNFMRDLVPVAGLVRAPHVLFVAPTFPPKTVAELIAYAKANPGKINFASAGTGTANHIAGEMFKMLAGIEMVHVPYRGGAPAIADVLSGQVQVMFSDVVTMAAQMKGGSKIRSLAIASNVKLPTLPNTPTVAATVPGFDTSSWWGVCAPRGTPGEIVNRLNAEINRGLEDPKIKQRFDEMGVLILRGSPEDFGRMIAEETDRWGKAIRFANLSED